MDIVCFNRWVAVLVVVSIAGCGGTEPPRVTETAPVTSLSAQTSDTKSVTPPIDFKGEKPGVMTYDEFTKAHGSRRRRPVVEYGEEVPGASLYVLEEGHLTIGGDSVVEAKYVFSGDILARIVLRVRGDRSRLVKALAEKYGQPRSEGQLDAWQSGGTNLAVVGEGDSFLVAFADDALASEIQKKAKDIVARKKADKESEARKDL